MYEVFDSKRKVLFDDFSMVILGLLVFFVTLICCCIEIDFTPVADDIYQPLYEQVQVIEEKGKAEALEMDNAIINNIDKTITIENSECKLVLIYDDEESLQVTKVDKSFAGTKLFSSLMLIFLGSLLFGYSFTTIFTAIGNGIYAFCRWLHKKIKEKIKLRKFNKTKK